MTGSNSLIKSLNARVTVRSMTPKRMAPTKSSGVKLCSGKFYILVFLVKTKMDG